MSNYFSDSCFVYILKCSDGSYYVGHTADIDARLKAHMHGQDCEYTALRLPVVLVFLKEFATRDEAFRIERQIKRWSRRKKEALIENKIDQLKQFASRSKLFRNRIIL
jgi:predicted GIY-YIG superfamily endonuclease